MNARVLAEIADHIGTPTYLYDGVRIAANYRRIADAFAGAAVHYSVKANGNLSILHLLHRLGAGFDVVSGGELKRALVAGADPAQIVFAGVGKRDDELIAALDAGIGWINVESEQELRVLSDLATAREKIQRVALRINPGIDAHTHRYLTTGEHASKFGLEVEHALQLVAARDDYPGVAMHGIHVHIGSMVNTAQPYLDAMNIALHTIRCCRAAGAAITALNLGGGFGIAYEPNQVALPIEAIAAVIMPRARQADVQVLIEPGRAIIADAGVLLTRVLYTKTNGDRRYAIVDAGMNDLIRPALYGARHRVTRIEDEESRIEADAPSRLYSVVGPICESGDILAAEVTLPELQRGDLLIIHDVGAYGMSMASNYNARPRAAEVLADGDRWRVIRRRETVEALMWGEEVLPALLAT